LLPELFTINVKTLQHCEAITAQAMESLGAMDIVNHKRMVSCKGDLNLVYAFNYQLPTALRVLVPIHSFKIKKGDEVHSQALKFEWDRFIKRDMTFAIDPNVHSEFFRHEHYASQILKDGIVDYFRNKYGIRPDVNPDNPDVLLHLHIDDRTANISLDSSGDSLNRRNLRIRASEAPMNEVLAAAIAHIVNWQPEDGPFYDGMCGGATIGIESFMKATQTPVQTKRTNFAFLKWANFDAEKWKDVQQRANQEITGLTQTMHMSDIAKRHADSAKINFDQLITNAMVHIEEKDFFELQPLSEKGILVMNPPYGERLSLVDAEKFYMAIGTRLKHAWKGHTCWIITSHTDAVKRIGLKPSKKYNFINGTLPCVLLRFDMFAGTRKDFVIQKKQMNPIP
jgi:putative N6-adenine-specific DNA methylase